MGTNKAVIIASIVIVSVLALVILLTQTKKLSKFDEAADTLNNTQKTLTYENVSAEELKMYQDSSKDIFLLDVHIPEQAHIENTDEFIPYNQIRSNASKLPEDKNTEIVVYCKSGNMSETASKTLIDMGYTNVKNLEGGINSWKAQGYSL